MDIETISGKELLTQTDLKPSHRSRKAKFVVGGILILLGFVALLLYLNPFDNSDAPLIDYNTYPFLKLTSLTDPDMRWDVFVDTPNHQVFLVKQLTPLSSSAAGGNQDKRRRLLSTQDIESLDETKITQVILHKFNEDHLTFYQLFEGDLNHAHCFRIPVTPGSELVPQKQELPVPANDNLPWEDQKIPAYKFKLFETAGFFAGMQFDSQGNLVEARFSNSKTSLIGWGPPTGQRRNPYPPIDDPHPYPFPFPDPNPNPFPRPIPYSDTGPFKLILHLDPSSISFKVAEPFDIDKIKTHLAEVGQCFDYSTEFNKPESAYETSKMKVPSLFDLRQRGNNSSRERRQEKLGETKKRSEIKNQDPLKKKLQKSIQKHGNWCGSHHGGFDNTCRETCNANLWNITEDCSKCNPPIDYTDRQCMLHDLCTARHKILKWGSNGCDSRASDAGESIPCECNEILMKELNVENLKKECKGDRDCMEKGKLIRDEIGGQPCGCKVDQYFTIPHFDESKVAQDKKRIKYEACLPTSICKLRK